MTGEVLTSFYQTKITKLITELMNRSEKTLFHSLGLRSGIMSAFLSIPCLDYKFRANPSLTLADQDIPTEEKLSLMHKL